MVTSTMTSSTVGNILTTGTNALGDTFSTILPVLLPAAIAVSIFFSVWFFIKGFGNKKI